MQKASSGIKSLDLLIDHINIGDNVVWEVDAGTSYDVFIRSFIRQSFEEAQKVIYVSFNRSPQSVLNEIKSMIKPEHFILLDCFTAGKGKNDAMFLNFYNKPSEFNVIRCDNPGDIKTFTAIINELEDSLPPDARYIFDSLTGMQDLWGDESSTYKFFTYMCPRLFDLDTVAYWILEKGAHSKNFKANLRHITQDVFDVYVRREKQYIKALKLAGRQNREAFKPHVYEIVNGEVNIISQSRETASDFGVRIREIRTRIGISQKDLADKMDVTPSFISQMENNQISPSLKSFIQMCRVLDVNPAHFLDDEKPVPLPKIFRRKDLSSRLTLRNDGTAGHALITSEKISVMFLVIPVGGIINGHFHSLRDHEFIFVGRGTVSVSFEDIQEVLFPGDGIYLADVMPTQWTNAGCDETELLVVW
jgi:transcriptional regulator with XRE-family HTH domain